MVCEKLEGDDLLQAATLVTAKGRWDVEIGHGSQGKLYFERGWDVFVQNHGLRVGEFAVFEYIGGICFNVSLLDKTGSEKVISELDEHSNLGEDGQDMDSKLNPLTQVSQDEVLPSERDSSSIEVADIDQEGEHADLVAGNLEEEEDMITSHLNARLAPLYAILAEMDNEDLPSHVNICEQDNHRGCSQVNIPKYDSNTCNTEQERNKESSSFPSPAEIGHKKACPSEVKIQEQHAIKVPMKIELDEEDEVPSQIKLQNPGKGRCSVKRKRDDKTIHSPVKIQKHDMNRCSMKQKKDVDKTPSQTKSQKQDMNNCSTKQEKDDDRAPSQAKNQKHDKSKSSVKHDSNNNCGKQKNHEDSKPKSCAQDKKEDTKSKLKLSLTAPLLYC